MEPRRYVVKFAFNGRNFQGYAKQPEGGTAEDEVVHCLQDARIVEDATSSDLASAGRVDKGVSAMGAAVAFDTPVPRNRLLRSMNANTDLLVAHSIARAQSGFDPRRGAASRWYRYHFSQTDPDTELDVPLMRRAASLFEGEHDFSAFARLEGRDPTRLVQQTSVERRGGAVVLDVWGRSFFRNQVRRMATAVRSVGVHGAEPADLALALETGRGAPFPPRRPEGSS